MNAMYYPTMMDLTCFNIIVVGGGKIAYQKTKELLHHGGKVKVISPTLCLLFEELDQTFEYKNAIYCKDDLKEATLVIAATDDKEVNDEIGHYCRESHILCNVVTDQSLSSFIVPASMRRGSLVISVSTEGKSPALAGKIKRELEAKFGEEYAVYVTLLGEAREKVKAEDMDEDSRRKILTGLPDMNERELRKILAK